MGSWRVIDQELTNFWPTLCTKSCPADFVLLFFYHERVQNPAGEKLTKSWTWIANSWHQHVHVEIAVVFLAVVFWQHPTYDLCRAHSTKNRWDATILSVCMYLERQPVHWNVARIIFLQAAEGEGLHLSVAEPPRGSHTQDDALQLGLALSLGVPPPPPPPSICMYVCIMYVYMYVCMHACTYPVVLKIPARFAQLNVNNPAIFALRRSICHFLGSVFGRTDFSRIFIFGPPDFFADFVAGFFLLIFFVGKSAQKNPPGKSQAKSSKIYTTKIPDTFLQRSRANILFSQSCRENCVKNPATFDAPNVATFSKLNALTLLTPFSRFLLFFSSLKPSSL